MKKLINAKKSVKALFLAATAVALLGSAGCSSESSAGDENEEQTNTNPQTTNTPAPNPDPNSGSVPPEKDEPQYGSGDVSTEVRDKPTVADVSNASVEIVKSEGWFNSAYIVFKQVEGATYKVLIDDKELDAPLIRYYDTYTYNEYDETSSTWKEGSYSKVVRADALGLAKGSHTMKVCAVGTENTSEYSTATMTVVDHDRSGFAFTGTTTPGAYNKDGTLKSGAVVLYLTQANKKTLTATIGGTTYTGIQAITQAIKTKNTGSTAFDIRVVGQVTAENNDLSCSDLKSAYALGVKGASNVTIEGVGHDATLKGAGVAVFKDSEYIEVANLGLVKWGGGKDGDGVSVKASSYVWVHHCDYFYGDAGSDADQVKGDGSMDLKDDANHMTISYNHFWDSGKMSLCGMKSETGPNYITYHHNWFDHSDSRHPRIRTMTVHVYNNYFDGNAKYGVGVTTGASCFVEGNYFRNAHSPMLSSKQGTDAQGSGTFSGEKGGVIKSWNNKFEEKNTNGVKFQFITNKYDYTNNKELGEYKEWYETVGTQNSDGTWTIYDSKVTNSDDTIATNSLIAIEDASKKGAYYQVSKSKTAFFIDIPSNTSKIIIKAKTGSSTSGATAGIDIKDEAEKTIASVTDIGNSAYSDYEFAISGLTADSTLEIVNSSSKNSLNISEIKVIASTGWNTKLTSGADLTNIDAYEVDARNELVPNTVTARSGGSTYSNFDTTMGDSGLGIAVAPTDPTQAKTDVVSYAGRHNPDIKWQFNNATDDASYAVDTSLNTMLVAYTTGLTAIQGTAASTSGNTDNTGNDDGDDDKGGSVEQPATPTDGSAASLTFNSSSALSAVSAGTTFTCAKGTDDAGSKDYYASSGKIKILKMENSTTISFKSPGTTSDSYTMKINYVATSEGKLNLTPSGGTASEITLAVGGSLSDKNSNSASTTSVTATISGGTDYVISRKSTETYIHSIIIIAN